MFKAMPNFSWKKRRHWSSWEGQWFLPQQGQCPISVIHSAPKGKKKCKLFTCFQCLLFLFFFFIDSRYLFNFTGQRRKQQKLDLQIYVFFSEKRSEEWSMLLPFPALLHGWDDFLLRSEKVCSRTLELIWNGILL